MAHVDYVPHFPYPVVDEAQLPPPIDDYPFLPLSSYQPKDLLDLLRDYVEDGHCFLGVKPLDFTRFTLARIFAHFHAENHTTPVYFFFHWYPHHTKSTRDVCQKTIHEDVVYSTWVEEKHSKVYFDHYEYRGRKNKYHLHESIIHDDEIEDRGGGGARNVATKYILEAYFLPNKMYKSCSCSSARDDNKPFMKSQWALCKLYLYKRKKSYKPRKKLVQLKGFRSPGSKGFRSSGSKGFRVSGSGVFSAKRFIGLG